MSFHSRTKGESDTSIGEDETREMKSGTLGNDDNSNESKTSDLIFSESEEIKSAERSEPG